MSTISCTIGGVSVVIKNGSFRIDDALSVRGQLTFTVEDPTGTLSFYARQPVVFSDSVKGPLFTGIVNKSQPVKLGPAGPTIEHVVTCVDRQDAVDKRTNTKNYLGWFSGDVFADSVRTTLGAEGVTVPASLDYDSTINDFNQGLLSNTVGAQTSGGSIGDGDLELASSGASVAIVESSTSQFATGTLTNVVASNNSLNPATESAVALVATLTLDTTNNYVYAEIWSGSMTVGTNDVLHYEIWVSGANPVHSAGISLDFSDTTSMQNSILTDSHGIGAAAWNDLSNAAVNQWYSRDIALTGLNGKTIVDVTVGIDGNVDTLKPGLYTVYYRNIYLQSQLGSPFFATNATQTQVNPPSILAISGFSTASVTCSIVQAVIATISSRISPAYSISAVKLLKSSIANWTTTILNSSNSTIGVNVSYDGGLSYQPCTANVALPSLPAAVNVAGMSITLQELFTITGGDPTSLPTLSNLAISLQSAPNSSKTDIYGSYTSQANWNTGTLTNLTANADGTLTLTSIKRDWNDKAISSQTSYFVSGTTQTAASGSYTMNVTKDHVDGKSRLDFAGTLTNFTLDVDITFDQYSQTGIVYRTTGWQAVNNTFAWLVTMDTSSGLQLGYGTNTSSGSGTYTLVTGITQSFLPNTTYHLTIVVAGVEHLVYLNRSNVPAVSTYHAAYQTAGQIGLRQYNFDSANTRLATWDNLVILQVYSGTWVSPSGSLSSVGTYSNSVVSWTEINTNPLIGSIIQVQASIDGGTTYKNCTNGAAIPNFIAGQSLSGVSIKFQVTINTTFGISIPSISGLTFRVLGSYGTVTGTRSTVPLGNDTVISRAVASGWSNAFDSQAWAQSGTGATSVGSGEALISATTGDVNMTLGSRTWTDMDGTDRLQVSAAGTSAGMNLRYVDANNFYRLSISTTGVTIVKRAAGATTILASVAASYATNIFYQIRFRVVGSSPCALSGRVWLDGTTEPTTWTITASD